MTSFLVRLAQRSIGQVPVVHSRAVLTPPLAGDSGTAAIADASAAPRAPALRSGEPPSPVTAALQIGNETPPASPPPTPTPVASMPPTETHAILTTRVISEVIERSSPSPRIPPIEPAQQEARPVGDIAHSPPSMAPLDPPAATVVIQAAAPPPIVKPDLATQGPTPGPSPTPSAPDLPATLSPAPQLTPIEFVQPRREPHPTESIDLTTALGPVRRDPPLPGLEIMPPSEPPVKAPPSEERIVQVRIGAIEIHAPAPPPAPAAIPMQRSVPRGGFDEFARLRSYAPWEW